jgi:hypothetical protein
MQNGWDPYMVHVVSLFLLTSEYVLLLKCPKIIKQGLDTISSLRQLSGCIKVQSSN